MIGTFVCHSAILSLSLSFELECASSPLVLRLWVHVLACGAEMLCDLLEQWDIEGRSQIRHDVRRKQSSGERFLSFRSFRLD